MQRRARPWATGRGSNELNGRLPDPTEFVYMVYLLVLTKGIDERVKLGAPVAVAPDSELENAAGG